MPYIGKKPADIIATVIDTTTGTFSGEVDAGSLDVSGNADIDGTTNLDNTDIDGTLNVQGETTLQTHLNMGDSDIIKLGAGADLQIYHDASNSQIINSVGHLNIDNNGDDKQINLRSDDGSGGITNYIRVNGNTGEVQLYNYGSEKLATTATGIDVTGTATMDGLTVEGSGTGLSINSTNDEVKKILFENSGSATGYIGSSSASPIRLLDGSATERLRIDSSGNLLVGTTSINPADNNDASGSQLSSIGSIQTSVSNATPAIFNRGNDGGIIGLLRAGVSVGSIGVVNTDRLYIGTPDGSQCAIRFDGDSQDILPSNASGTALDDAISLGDGGTRFKDLYLSGDITFGDSHFIGDSGADNLLIQSSGAENIEYNSGNGAHLFHKNGSEMARIANDGHIIVGRTSLLTDFGDGRTSLVLQGTGSQDYATIQIGNNGTASDTQILGILAFYDGVNNNARVQAVRNNATDSADLLFHTRANGGSLTERMRIQANGRITVNTTDSDGHMHVFGNYADGYAGVFHNDGNNSNRKGILVKSGYDSSGGTNKAIDIADGNGTVQGQITFSNGTVVYGAFTAFHPCIIPNADNDPNSETNAYPYGTLLEITSISYTQKDGVNTERGIRYNVQKSSSAKSKAVLGAYGSSMNDEDNDNMHQALVLGDGHILCNNENGNIAVGDYICTSSVSGEGMKATSICTTIGIAREAITFTDSTAVLVAVEYGYRQFVPEDLEARIVALENA